MTESNGSGGERWSRPQHAVAYAEARAVLNAQQQRKATLDDVALRTARLTTAIVGVVVTATQTFGIELANPLGYVGLGLLILSFGSALGAYGFSGPVLGPNASGLRDLIDGEDGWERTFLLQMEGAVGTNGERLDQSSILVLLSDVGLFVGVIVTITAIAL